MSVETNDDAFRANIREEIRKIQEELNELKTINQSSIKKITSKKPAKKITTKRESAKSKPVRKVMKSKKKANR